MLSSSQHVKKDLVTTAIENGSFTTLCSCSWCTADLSAHSYSQLVVPSHCLCTYLPTMHLLCGLIVRQIGTLVLLLPDTSRCTYLTSILTYHMLRVVKSFSFCTIGWTNDPYRPRRKCSVLLHIPMTTENDPTILSVSIMPTWSRWMC